MIQIHSRIHKVLSAFVYLLFLYSLVSCSSPQNVAYFQDADDIVGMMLPEERPFRMRPLDKLNIIVHSSDPMLQQQFTLQNLNVGRSLGAIVTPQTTAGNTYSSYGTPVAYTVDSQGDINFPVLGKISVLGKTRQEVAEYIAQRLIARELVKDPLVTVEFVNLGIDVLGEVAHPGHIDILKDHFTILDAISRAGDLTINGCRDRVLVCRDEDGAEMNYYVDLTNRQDLLLSPVYYLQQNDVIYVQPNEKRQRESTASGNTFNTPGFWMSFTTLLMTVITFLK